MLDHSRHSIQYHCANAICFHLCKQQTFTNEINQTSRGKMATNTVIKNARFVAFEDNELEDFLKPKQSQNTINCTKTAHSLQEVLRGNNKYSGHQYRHSSRVGQSPHQILSGSKKTKW